MCHFSWDLVQHVRSSSICIYLLLYTDRKVHGNYCWGRGLSQWQNERLLEPLERKKNSLITRFVSCTIQCFRTENFSEYFLSVKNGIFVSALICFRICDSTCPSAGKFAPLSIYLSAVCTVSCICLSVCFYFCVSTCLFSCSLSLVQSTCLSVAVCHCVSVLVCLLSFICLFFCLLYCTVFARMLSFVDALRFRIELATKRLITKRKCTNASYVLKD
jgi:hypothetical protein